MPPVAVELWQLAIAAAPIIAGLWALWQQQRTTIQWRSEVTGHLKRLDLDDLIQWRATVDAALVAHARGDEEHRDDHRAIMSRLGEVKEAVAALGTRIAVLEHRERP